MSIIATIVRLLFESIASVLDEKHGLLSVWLFGILFIAVLIGTIKFLIW